MFNESILEKHGVTATYFKRKRMDRDEVVHELINNASNSIARMNNASNIRGKHSNAGELLWIKEALEEKC